jgi:hypothetical protein
MSVSCLDLGPFTFPPKMDIGHQWHDLSTTAVAHCIRGRGYEDA